MGKHGDKLGKVVKSRSEKWGEMGKSGGKVGKSGEMMGKMGKSGEKLEKVGKGGVVFFFNF